MPSALPLLTQSIGNPNSLLNGYMNGSPFFPADGGQARPLAGLISPRRTYPPGGLLSALTRRLNSGTKDSPKIKQPTEEEDRVKHEDESRSKGGDKADLSQFARDAIKEAAQNARLSLVNGTTEQVLVSEDGRYQATVDLVLAPDGSFDLEVSTGMASSRTTGVQPLTGQNPPMPMYQVTDGHGGLTVASASVIQETSVEYERLISTRDWEARIFYSSTERLAAGVSRAHGLAVADRVLSAGAQLSREYQLNISISGKSLDRFLAQIDELSASEDTSDLAGFLDAVENVLTTSPDMVEDLLKATEALIERVGEQITAAVDQFFAGMWETLGAQLPQFGFDDEWVADMSNQAKQGLTNFLEATNHLFENILGPQAEQTLHDLDAELTKQLVEESLDRAREAMEENLQQAENSGAAAPPALDLEV